MGGEVVCVKQSGLSVRLIQVLTQELFIKKHLLGQPSLSGVVAKKVSIYSRVHQVVCIEFVECALRPAI
jgi:hypothetical protein